VACPGDTLEIKDNHLIVNSVPLDYELLRTSYSPEIRSRNQIGSVIELEQSNGQRHTITYSPSSIPKRAVGPLTVPSGAYYMLGDNRSKSLDSRHYGPVPRHRIRGKVSLPLFR
jgi:signal peptidase I